MFVVFFLMPLLLYGAFASQTKVKEDVMLKCSFQMFYFIFQNILRQKKTA